MTARAFRVVQSRFKQDAFSGEGARLHGGRWNSPGTPAVYLSESLSLAMLELLVHLDDESLLESYVAFEVHIPTLLIKRVALKDLPRRWDRSPVDQASQSYGDRFLTAAGTEVALALPSAVVRSEANYLVNPRHPRITDLRIGKPERLRLDRRLR